MPIVVILPKLGADFTFATDSFGGATYIRFCVQLSSSHREPRLSVLPWGGRPRAPADICRGGIIIRVRGCAARFCKDGEIQRFSVFP